MDCDDPRDDPPKLCSNANKESAELDPRLVPTDVLLVFWELVLVGNKLDLDENNKLVCGNIGGCFLLSLSLPKEIFK